MLVATSMTTAAASVALLAPGAAAADPSLVAAFGFDEASGTSALDASGNGHTGAVTGTLSRTTAGKFGGALVFNGTSTKVTVPDAADLRLTSAATLEAWVKPAQTSTKWRDVIYKGDDNYYLEGSSVPGGRPAAGVKAAGVIREAFASGSLATSVWAHLALTYDGTAVRLYLNAVQVASTAATGAIATSTNPLQIGGNSIYGQYFAGTIDEVRIYNVARTPAQLQSDMNTAVAAPPDAVPPTAPSGLGATAAGSTQVNLAWTAATDNVAVTGYRVERCAGSGCGTFVEVGSSATTTFADTLLTAGTTYVYRVRAIDAAGNLGPYSGTASATTTTPDTTPPTAPGNLTATATGSSGVDLAWDAATDNIGVTGYRLERCQGTGCSPFTQIAALTARTYSDTGLAANTRYEYRVRAIDAAGNLGAYSLIASATTSGTPPDTTLPSAPGTLSVTSDATPSATLNWGAATDNVAVTGYRIDRCSGTACQDFTHLVQLNGTGTTYTDTRVTNSTSYSYQVSALDAAGNIGPVSNQASTSVPAATTSLVAAYGFGETSGASALDASGRGHTGTISGATRTTSGRFGNALSFNGSNAFVTIPDASDLRLTTGMTLEAWVNPASSSSSWADVVYKGDDNYYLESSSTRGGIPVGGTIVTGGHQEAEGTAPLPANTWSHLALTYDGAAVRLFLNGTQVGSAPASGAMATSTNPVQIGGDSIYGQFFSGLIDEVRIFNVARTGAQIQGDMTVAVGAPSDAVPPSAPSALTATATSGSQINLAWTGSTDNVGVTGYQIERCAGTGCTDFSFVSTAATTTYADTALSPFTSYSYRVVAVDAAGNRSNPSNTATASTGVGVAPRVATLTPGATQQFTVSGATGQVTYSVDGTVGGSSTVGTITGAGLYTAPQAEGTHTISATDGATTASPATVYVTSYAGTLTHHNNVERTGANLDETVLNPARVTPSTFGKVTTFATDGVSHSSPLYVPDVPVTGVGVRNVVFVATEHDSVYAFDADARQSTPLWKRSFINPAAGVTTVPALDTGECCDIQPEIGITGTPVIDAATRTLYVVAKTKEVSGQTTSYVQRLHAISLADGSERAGSPVVISASVPGTGNGAVGGVLPFDALHENQRVGLLLRNGVVYMAFASHGDHQPYHGWILGYDAATLAQSLVFCLTPDGEGAGVWHSGGGLASDTSGDIYFVSGDGTFDVSSGGRNYGDTIMRLRPNATVADWFTPYNQQELDDGNHDLGAGGVALLPDQPGAHPHELVTAGKNGTIYLVDRDNMGHFHAGNDSQIVQSLPNIFPNGTPEPGNFSAPVYWNGFVYFSPVADKVMAFSMTNGLLSTSPTMKSSTSFAFPGGSIAVSANGNTAGILWAVERTSASTAGTLHAYDARNLGSTFTELWNSNQSGARDSLDIAAKYAIPLVANGRVYVSTVSTLTVYGLLG